MRIGVIGGASLHPAASHAARVLGAEVAVRCWGMVAADQAEATASAARCCGVDVIDVLPRGLPAPSAPGGSDVRRVADARRRTSAVVALADAVVALPGGMDLLADVVGLAADVALGRTLKPCALLDVDAAFAPLTELLAAVPGVPPDALMVDDDPVRLLDRLTAWRPYHVLGGDGPITELLAWLHVAEGGLLVLPGSAGTLTRLVVAARDPACSGRRTLSEALWREHGLTVAPQQLRLASALALPDHAGPSGAMLRVSCYRSVPGTGPPGLERFAVLRPVERDGCDPLLAEVMARLDELV